ncbi:MAG: erythromycin esterase family protein [Candidatus Aminicenantes bacterium]
MKHTSIRIYLVILLFFFISAYLPSQKKSAAQESLLDKFNQIIQELPNLSPLDFPDDFFTFLDPVFSQAQVIGLGEATHGTREFFELKQRLLRYLVENHNVRALGFEFDFRFESSLNIERFVTEGKGDINALFSGLYWTHRNQELKDLILWMKKYNSDKKEPEKVHFLGIDSQLDIWYTDELFDELYRFDKGLFEYLREYRNQLKSLGKIDHKKMSTEKYNQIKSLLSQLKELTCTYFTENPSDAEATHRKLLIHLIDSYLLSHELRFLLPQKKNVRDRHMADHCLWLKEFVEDHQKIAVWAHNSHVAKNPHYTSDGSPAMGEYLKKKLGPAYLSIATSFSNGCFAAVTDDYSGADTKPIIWEIKSDPLLNSPNYLFHNADFQNFIFLISSLEKDSELFKYFNQPLPFLGIGDFFTRDIEDHYRFNHATNLAQFYDVVFHFRNTNPINILENAEK